MIDLKDLRANPDRYRQGCRDKNVPVDIDLLLRLDEDRRRILSEQERLRAEQKSISREIGPRMGQLKGKLGKAAPDERVAIEAELAQLEARPVALKTDIQALETKLAQIEPPWRDLWLQVPLPPDSDVPRGAGSEENVEIRRWSPAWFDPAKSFHENRGFAPRSHLDLMARHGMVDFERAVRMSGTRHYSLTADGMRLHQAVLRFALDFISDEHGFSPMSVLVIVREECMVGTGFFPAGREQAYHVEESRRGGGHDLFLTGTGEVGLMGFHADEILEVSDLPRKYATVSTCFRREAGAAGKDTAGLYRIHQFDKVEQVVICRADEAESRAWHKKMIGIVEELLRRLEIPHRLLQCCTGDLGVKNADMIDIESWMPSRGDVGSDGAPSGAWGETHSASRLYDFQCRRLNLRYRDEQGEVRPCHSLNNTVLASPRVLIPIIELYQQEDGSITIPAALRPYVGARAKIG